jgi:hypothetical protein
MIVDTSGSMRKYLRELNDQAEVFFFTGTIPKAISDIAFNINDPHELINNSVGCTAVEKFEKLEGGIIGFKTTGYNTLRKGVGVRESGEAYIRAIPDKVYFSNPEHNITGLGAAVEYLSSIHTEDKNLEGYAGILNNPNGLGASKGNTIEFEFKDPVKTTGINIQTLDSLAYIRPLDVEYYDGVSDWIKIAGWSASDISINFNIIKTDSFDGNIFDFGRVVEATKFRIVTYDNSSANGGDNVYYQYLRNINFVVSEIPDSQILEPITWSLLVFNGTPLKEGQLIALVFNVGDSLDTDVGMKISNKNVQPMLPIRVSYCQLDFTITEV